MTLVHTSIMSLNTTFMVPLSFFNKIVVETYGLANTAQQLFCHEAITLGQLMITNDMKATLMTNKNALPHPPNGKMELMCTYLILLFTGFISLY